MQRLESVLHRIRPGVAADGLESVLEQVVASAGLAWPSLAIDPEAFLSWVAERLTAESDPRVELPSLRAGDLFLASRCAAGDPAALAAFDTHYVPAIRRLARFGPDAWFDDFLQELRQRLFLGSEPAIARYSGRGELKNWFRVLATRALIDERRRNAPERPVGLLPEGVAVAASPELALVKASARRGFRTAFESATRALTPAQRNVLRLHYVDGLSIDRIGVLYGVHRASAARRIASARRDLAGVLRRSLHDVSAGDVQGLLGLVESQSLSLGRLLATGE